MPEESLCIVKIWQILFDFHEKIYFGPKMTLDNAEEHRIHNDSTRRIERDGPEVPVTQWISKSDISKFKI